MKHCWHYWRYRHKFWPEAPDMHRLRRHCSPCCQRMIDADGKAAILKARS